MTPDTFVPEMEIERIVEFIRDTFTKAHKKKAVIAVSGGIDSAISFALTVKALGQTHVHAYHLPAKNSNPIHLQDTQELVKKISLSKQFQVIPVGSMIQKSWRVIQHNSTPEESTSATSGVNKLRLANIAARVRMMVIFDQAKKLDGLVVGTENYSEHLLGYFTRFGDEASDIEPIRHLFKTQVIELARLLDVPQSIIDKPPSADLWKGQTDAGELGFTYEEADPILMMLDQGITNEEMISRGYESRLIQAVIKRVKASDFKHEVPYSLLNR